MLFHTAISAAQHRTFLRNMDVEFTGLPFDITFQGVASLCLIMFSILQTGGDFKEIRACVDLSAKLWETNRNFSSFYKFNHRGKVISCC
ncbi:LOW QUALITY PROTEIN: membrane magnesium transporter 1-like [Ctenocephalides felis]|uniref:LOW QUALITY PROTEIN: membrane magnesium transporter 1-like n=1 Tax=Ctenocephalides felis TaxID=7515 RepID=UPI000E6E43A8|nr:LOW QUALITY PROTEIN: membrane magnesium transporter 1-like [Ctenocephalides felis]